MDFFCLAGEQFDERVRNETESEAVGDVVSERHAEDDEKCRNPLAKSSRLHFFQLTTHYLPFTIFRQQPAE